MVNLSLDEDSIIEEVEENKVIFILMSYPKVLKYWDT